MCWTKQEPATSRLTRRRTSCGSPTKKAANVLPSRSPRPSKQEKNILPDRDICRLKNCATLSKDTIHRDLHCHSGWRSRVLVVACAGSFPIVIPHGDGEAR